MPIFKIKVLSVSSLLPHIFIYILSMSPTIIPDSECSSIRNWGWGYLHYRFWIRKIIYDVTIYFIALYEYETLCDWTSKQPFLILCDFYTLKTINSTEKLQVAPTTTQLMVPSLALKSLEAWWSTPVTGSQRNIWSTGDWSKNKSTDSNSRVLLVVFPGLTVSLLLALFHTLVLFRVSISMKTSYSSFPALFLSLNPYKGLKLTVSSGACHSHSSLC